MELSVSILNASNKKEMINLLNNTEILYIHLDVMDGKFVSEKSLPLEEIQELSKLSTKKLDVHLMVDNPIEYLEGIKNLSNIEYVTIHLEIDKNIKKILSQIKSYGYKTGLSIKPTTKVEELLPYLDDLDLILLMTVEPGLGGQPILESSTSRLRELKNIVNDNIKIEVDGGINNKTITQVKEADIAVVGTYITKSDDPVEKINNLMV